MQAAKYRLGGNGLHLYPLFYWDWPYAPDKAEPRMLQLDRDWMWYEAWFRYAWNPERDEKDESLYWTKRVGEHYQIDSQAAGLLVEAMNSAGQIAPKILGRIGITEGNRQTFSLGMTLSQITNVNRYGPNRELWHSVARAGEQPDDYITKELAGRPHVGETPYDMIEEVKADAEAALSKCEQAFGLINEPCLELRRIKSDIEALYHLTRFYCFKLEAGMEVLKYKYTMDEQFRGDFSLLDKAEGLLAQSLEAYKSLRQSPSGLIFMPTASRPGTAKFRSPTVSCMTIGASACRNMNGSMRTSAAISPGSKQAICPSSRLVPNHPYRKPRSSCWAATASCTRW